jgi:hypothetical protein
MAIDEAKLQQLLGKMLGEVGAAMGIDPVRAARVNRIVRNSATGVQVAQCYQGQSRRLVRPLRRKQNVGG